MTWENERCVEIPVVMKEMIDSFSKRILEVGNVLSHYTSFDHQIIDKYEKQAGVINQDIIEYFSSSKYDLIVSISTLEHVGWDEEPKDPKKILAAVGVLKGLLARGGKLIITLPIGYNENMDELLGRGVLRFDEQRYLKRLGYDEWVETDWEGIQSLKYGYPFRGANGLIIAIIFA
jgi:hypothetical protein